VVSGEVEGLAQLYPELTRKVIMGLTERKDKEGGLSKI
jgi:hypothetical protein